jgi:ribosomal protein S16
MATRIRLRRVGRKKQPVPRSEPATIQVDVEKARAWLEKGATPSETVRSLLKRAGVFETATGS